MSAIALLLTGTVGVGKSTTAEGVGEALQVVGVPHAVIDLDAIRCSWPTPADDPFGFDLELRNLAPLVTNFLMAGAQRLVLAGVCESQRDRERYQTAPRSSRLRINLSKAMPEPPYIEPGTVTRIWGSLTHPGPERPTSAAQSSPSTLSTASSPATAS